VGGVIDISDEPKVRVPIEVVLAVPDTALSSEAE